MFLAMLTQGNDLHQSFAATVVETPVHTMLSTISTALAIRERSGRSC